MADLEVAQVEFLWKAMSAIPQNDDSYILKCHLMSKCRSLHDKGYVRLPMRYIQKSSMCQFCSNLWKDGKYSLKILPEKAPPKSIKKILSRYSKNPTGLRKFEIGLAKKYAQKKNTLVITCGVCSKETKIDTIKPERKKTASEELPKEPSLITKKKKKKWVKDPTAGLKIPADLVTRSTSMNNTKGQKLDVSDEHMLAKSKFSVSKNNENLNVKGSISSEDMGVMTMNNKKRKKQMEDSDSSFERGKKIYRPKIETKPEVFTKDKKLIKLVKNNKLGNILTKSKKVPESPLTKFLSNL